MKLLFCLSLLTSFFVATLSKSHAMAFDVGIEPRSVFGADHFVPVASDATGHDRDWCFRHFVEKNYTKAIEACGAAIKSEPSDPEPYSNRGSAYLIHGEFDLALTDFNMAIRLNPADSRHYYNRALVYDAKSLHLLAVEDYSEAIKHNPRFAAAYYNRAGALSALGEKDKAVADFNKAAEIEPRLLELIPKNMRRSPQPL